MGLFSCGAALVGWSFGENRQELWNIGAPMALVGQAAFLIGLLLQLDIIWQQNKQTSQRLDELDQRASTFPSSALSTTPTLDPGSSLGSATQDAESLLRELKLKLDGVATRLTRHKHSG
jgi:hypothetical protein